MGAARGEAEGEAARAAERAARESYGRLLAFVCLHTRDLAAAEDALCEAFAAALETWPRTGPPTSPEAWLLTAARRRLVDAGRRAQVRRSAAAHLTLLAEEAAAQPQPGGFPDHRLGLLLACAHPQIDRAARAPLMLQAVLGLDAARIARVFLVSPASMSQRLVRAKARIRKAGLAFSAPDPDAVPDRVGAVAEAVYAAYTASLESPDGVAEEAVWLARLLASLAPEDAETKGLLALILFSWSRRDARRTAEGRYVPLAEQDVALWRRDEIREARALLAAAAASGELGRFQIEAAIQAVHVRRAETGRKDAHAVARLYDLLVDIAPSLGAEVARAAAIGEARSPEEGLAALEAAPADRLAGYQPYWAVRGHLLAELGRRPEAREALARAALLSDDPAVIAHLQGRIAALADA